MTYEYFGLALHKLDKTKSKGALGRHFLRKSDATERPCEVYFYQTSNSGVRKFGIAWDHEARAANASPHEKKRYVECLGFYTLPTRADAILAEKYLRQMLEEPDMTKKANSSLGGIELTTSSLCDFNNAMLAFIQKLNRGEDREIMEATALQAWELDPWSKGWEIGGGFFEKFHRHRVKALIEGKLGLMNHFGLDTIYCLQNLAIGTFYDDWKTNGFLCKDRWFEWGIFMDYAADKGVILTEQELAIAVH